MPPGGGHPPRRRWSGRGPPPPLPTEARAPRVRNGSVTGAWTMRTWPIAPYPRNALTRSTICPLSCWSRIAFGPSTRRTRSAGLPSEWGPFRPDDLFRPRAVGKARADDIPPRGDQVGGGDAPPRAHRLEQLADELGEFDGAAPSRSVAGGHGVWGFSHGAEPAETAIAAFCTVRDAIARERHKMTIKSDGLCACCVVLTRPGRITMVPAIFSGRGRIPPVFLGLRRRTR